MYRRKIFSERINEKKEVKILYELGLEPFEVDFLMHERHKRDLSDKWRD